MMKRRILSLVLAALLMAGCGSRVPEGTAPAVTTTTGGEVTGGATSGLPATVPPATLPPVTATTGEAPSHAVFGEMAYAYVEHIQEELPARISGTVQERAAADFILGELQAAGYTDRQIQEQPFSYVKQDGRSYQSQNLIITREGKGEGFIVVGAHYDSIDGHGADDNGSGVGLLMETAARLADAELPYTVKFIFFGAEENGIFGSSHYVSSLTPEELKDIRLMVNLDCVMAGDRPYIFGGKFVKGRIVDTWAAERAKQTADAWGLSMYLDTELEPRHLLFMSDQGPFREADIPYVFFLAGNLDYYPEDPYRQTEKLPAFMNTPQDDLMLFKETFPGRAEERLGDYATLLYYFLLEMEIGAAG